MHELLKLILIFTLLNTVFIGGAIIMCGVLLDQVSAIRRENKKGPARR